MKKKATSNTAVKSVRKVVKAASTGKKVSGSGGGKKTLKRPSKTGSEKRAKKSPAKAVKKAAATKPAPPKKKTTRAVSPRTAGKAKPKPKAKAPTKQRSLSGRRRDNGKHSRWRDGGGTSPRIRFRFGKRLRGETVWINTDELEYTDAYTGDPYAVTSGETIDCGYQFDFPPEPSSGTPEEAVSVEVVIDSGDGTEAWVDYSAEGDSTTTSTDEMWVDPYYVDEFIEYYEPDPCDSAYQMSNGYGSWGILG